MNIKDTIIFSIAVVLLIIGLHQSMTVGFASSYWLFMLTIVLLLWYKKRKNKRQENGQDFNGNNKKSHIDKKAKR